MIIFTGIEWNIYRNVGISLKEYWNTFTVRVHKNHSSQQMFDLRGTLFCFFEERLVARVGVHQAVKSWFDHPNRFPVRNMYGINMYSG